MSDLRKAAEMALEFCEDIGDLGGPYPYVNETAVVSDSRKVLQALRQALAQTEKPPVKTYCGGKPNYCAPEVTPEVTGEVTEEVGACVTCGAPKSEWLVDAVNMSQERVDETAKREHEPVAWAYPEFFDGLKNNGCWTVYEKEGKGPHRDGIERTPLYTAPPKREWVGLTDEEINDWFFQRLKQAGAGWALDDVVRAVEAKLKEKNT